MTEYMPEEFENDTEFARVRWQDRAGEDESFDRWLNEIRAEAWQEGAESAFYDPEIRDLVDYPENPYRNNEK